MTKITCLERFFDNEENIVGSFLLEPLEISQGITIGNALRRTLLSEISGIGITGARINQLKHEFTPITGIREDPLEILMNLKEINIKGSFPFRSTLAKKKQIAYLKVQGPKVVTAAMFKLPKNFLKIINPTQYICTIIDSSTLFLEIDIEKGYGYRLLEEKDSLKRNEKFLPAQPRTLYLDTLFNPIRSVNFKVRLIHDTHGNLKESLFLQIVSNGSITPQRALTESLSVLLKLLSRLLLTSDVLKISSELSQDIKKIKKV